MKLYQEPVEVQCCPLGLPQRVRWRRKWHRVLQIEERWLYNGLWWTTTELRGECRRYYRLLGAPKTGSPLWLDVYEQEGVWTLARLLD